MVLNPGDIGFVQYNANKTDNFSFVVFSDIEPGEEIRFTDKGWLSDNSGFRGNEGIIVWTAPVNGVSAGTIVTIENIPSTNIGNALMPEGGFNFSTEGDQVIAYQDNNGVIRPIAALQNNGNQRFESDATSTNTSALPLGLTLGKSAIAISEINNIMYDGPTTGNQATLQTELYNPANWSTGSETSTQHFRGTFTVKQKSTADVIIIPARLNVSEEGIRGEYDIRLSTIPTNPVTISFAVGDEVEPIAPLTFANDATALMGQTVIISAIDDDDVEGDHEQTITHTVTSDDVNYSNFAVDSVTVTIADNDKELTKTPTDAGTEAIANNSIHYAVDIETSSITEPDIESQWVTLKITRSGALNTPSSLKYSLIGTATLDTDFHIPGNKNTASFDIGETTQTINVEILGDTEVEPDETIEIVLSPGTVPGKATLSEHTVTITLVNDDGLMGTALPDIQFETIEFEETKKGTRHRDIVRGTRNSDILYGLGGDDRIIGGRKRGTAGSDYLFGGDGDDILRDGKGSDYLNGGKGNDILKSGGHRDMLVGDHGNDKLLGGKGNDILIGERGSDRIKGGKGSDMIVYSKLQDGGDTLVKFDVNEDVIDLSNLVTKPAFSATSSFKEFQRYVQLIQVKNGTELHIDRDGNGLGNTTVMLALLESIDADSLSSENFVMS